MLKRVRLQTHGYRSGFSRREFFCNTRRSAVHTFRSGGWRLATIAPDVSISGDFDIIVEYDQFTPEVKDGSANLMLVAKFDEQSNSEALLQRRYVGASQKNEQLIQCATVEAAVGGEKRDYFSSKTHEESSGRLRMSRRGKVIHYLSGRRNVSQLSCLGV